VALLAATGIVLASSEPSPVFTGAIALWLALCTVAYWLMRANLLQHAKLSEMETRLALGRQPRAQGEKTVAASHALAGRLVQDQADVRDAERSRIAREIHDDLGQNLLALRIDLSLMQVATHGIHPAINQKVGQMASNLDHAIRSLRAVINNLRPLALEAGLLGAIEQQVAEFSRLSGIACELELAGDACEGCAEGSEAILYRVLQESLSNVTRHSRANRVRVTLARDAGRVVLRIQDDGIGIQHRAPRGHCGLAGMRERASAAGGELLVDSGAGAGTVVTVALPAGCPHPA
jgi:signal transduction histidine kinase